MTALWELFAGERVCEVCGGSGEYRVESFDCGGCELGECGGHWWCAVCARADGAPVEV